MKTMWAPVRTERLDLVRQQYDDAGIRVEHHVSPHEIPDGIRIDYDEKTERLALVFRYLDNESTTAFALDDESKVKVGQNSGRIYEVSFPFDISLSKGDQSPPAFDATVNRAFEHLVARNNVGRLPVRYRLAHEATKDISCLWGEIDEYRRASHEKHDSP